MGRRLVVIRNRDKILGTTLSTVNYTGQDTGHNSVWDIGHDTGQDTGCCTVWTVWTVDTGLFIRTLTPEVTLAEAASIVPTYLNVPYKRFEELLLLKRLCCIYCV